MSSRERVAALLSEAQQTLQNRFRRADAEETQFLAQFKPHEAKPHSELAKFDSEKRKIQLSLDRLALYAPTPGSETCPICFASGNDNAPLSVQIHPGEGAAPDKHTFSCIIPGCGFSALVGPI